MDQLAKDYSFTYDVIKADIDEKAIRHEQPRQLVLALAHAKADAIIQQLQQGGEQQQQPSDSQAGSNGSSSEGYLITCDQVVVHEGQIREKPEDVAEAHRCENRSLVWVCDDISITQYKRGGAECSKSYVRTWLMH